MNLTPDTQATPLSALHRRTFLKVCTGAGLAAASLSASAMETEKPGRQSPPRRMLIIDALGEISNSNLPQADQDGPEKGIDARALADAKVSGLCAFNQTLGYVAGKEDPFEHSIREIGVWDALIRRKADSLIKVLTANDIR